MKLNRKWILVMSLVLSVAMATTGTLAYLTDSDATVNVMTLGKVSIEQHEYERKVNADGTYKTDTIDNQNSYVLKDFSQGKPLVPTTEIDADGNPVNFGAGDYDDTTVRMSQVASYGGMQVFESENAQDKFVTVENTGRTDAYVRTIVALEAGSVSAEEWGNLIRTSHHFTWDDPAEKGIVNIDGNNYMIVEFVYKGWEQNRHVGGVLPAGETTYPNLSQVYMTAKATNEDVEKLDGNNNGLYDIMVLSQAVQADGFDDAATALKAGFGEVNAANVQKWFGDIDNEYDYSLVTGETELAEALKAGKSVKLANDITLTNTRIDVEDGQEIVLDMNGKTITDTKSTGMTAWVKDGGKLTITGNGTINKVNHSANMIYFDGELNIMNGTFAYEPYTWGECTAESECANTHGTNALKVGSILVGRKGTEHQGVLTIYGGTFDCGIENPEDFLSTNGEIVDTAKPVTMYAVINSNAGHPMQATIYGGTFVSANPASGDVNKPYTLYLAGQTEAWQVPDGYTITEGTTADGRTTYTVNYNK